MMTAWLAENEAGQFSFTGLVDPTDATVITPQATVNYGYNWFSLSEGPAVLTTPEYERFFSVSIFDMKHNVPAVIVNPALPILPTPPGYDRPEGDFTVVELETDQGIVLTRMVVVDNLEEVIALSEQITMQGGAGDMARPVQRFPTICGAVPSTSSRQWSKCGPHRAVEGAWQWVWRRRASRHR